MHTTLNRRARDAEGGRRGGQPIQMMQCHAHPAGNILRSIENAQDKGRLFEQLLLDQAASDGRSNSGEGAGRALSVYIGDSASDVLPMLAVRAFC